MQPGSYTSHFHNAQVRPGSFVGSTRIAWTANAAQNDQALPFGAPALVYPVWEVISNGFASCRLRDELAAGWVNFDNLANRHIGVGIKDGILKSSVGDNPKLIDMVSGAVVTPGNTDVLLKFRLFGRPLVNVGALPPQGDSAPNICYFESKEFDLSLAAPVDVVNQSGQMPLAWDLSYRCIAAGQNWNVGDTGIYKPSTGAATSGGFSVRLSSTKFTFSGNLLKAIDPTGTPVNQTVANFKFRLRWYASVPQGGLPPQSFMRGGDIQGQGPKVMVHSARFAASVTQAVIPNLTGRMPVLAQMFLVNKIAENGFVPGQVVPHPLGLTLAAGDTGFNLLANERGLQLTRVVAGSRLCRLDTGATVALTAANWDWFLVYVA